MRLAAVFPTYHHQRSNHILLPVLILSFIPDIFSFLSLTAFSHKPFKMTPIMLQRSIYLQKSVQKRFCCMLPHSSKTYFIATSTCFFKETVDNLSCWCISFLSYAFRLLCLVGFSILIPIFILMCRNTLNRPQ